MARMHFDSIRFDKQFWPEGGTSVNSLPRDLNELWDIYPDQADTFVAEALIANAPEFIVDLTSGSAKIESFLWDIGNDVVVVDAALGPLIESAIEDYDPIRSEVQADDIRDRLAALTELEASIVRAKTFAQKQLAEFNASASPESDSAP